MNKIVGYRLEPVYESEFSGMQPAASTKCPISYRCIWGAGARRNILHPTVTELLLEDKTAQELIRLRLHEKENIK